MFPLFPQIGYEPSAVTASLSVFHLDSGTFLILGSWCCVSPDLQRATHLHSTPVDYGRLLWAVDSSVSSGRLPWAVGGAKLERCSSSENNSLTSKETKVLQPLLLFLFSTGLPPWVE